MRPPEPSLSAEILAIGIASILLPSPYTHCRLAPGPIGFGHFPSGWAGFWPFLESSTVAIRTVLESGFVYQLMDFARPSGETGGG